MAISPSDRERLRASRFLNGAPETALHHLAKIVELKVFKTDELLFDEGTARDFMAIIASGAVAIEKSHEARPVRLVTLGVGEAIGEGLVLDDSPHGTSARALVNTTAFIITAEQLKSLIREAPAVYAALVARAARAISQRLSATDATLVGRGRTLGFTGGRSRTEHDLLGDREVPDDALYGIQTLRATENFPITGIPLREFPALIDALAAVKEAAARANAELGLMKPEIADVIARVAQELRA